MLREALMALILEVGYDAVTVEEITSRADVGRTTFYLHYHDKEDLLVESVNAILDDLISKIAKLPLSVWQIQPAPGEQTIAYTPILQIFEHAAENADLYRIILRGEGAFRAQKQVRAIIAAAVDDYLRQKLAQEEPSIVPVVPRDVFANYFAGSLLSTLNWWLESDMPYSTKQMTEMFQVLFFPGAGEALGFSFP
jgi:AcrR family transcriptional regulator